MTHNTSPTSNDAPDGWGDIHALLARQPDRTLSLEREAAMTNRVERAIATPRPLHQRPTVRRGVFATGMAVAVLSTVWFTGVFDGDAPATPPSSATVQNSSQPTKPRVGRRNNNRPRPAFIPPVITAPSPPANIDTSIPLMPQPGTPGTAADPHYTPGPGGR